MLYILIDLGQKKTLFMDENACQMDKKIIDTCTARSLRLSNFFKRCVSHHSNKCTKNHHPNIRFNEFYFLLTFLLLFKRWIVDMKSLYMYTPTKSINSICAACCWIFHSLFLSFPFSSGDKHKNSGCRSSMLCLWDKYKCMLWMWS